MTDPVVVTWDGLDTCSAQGIQDLRQRLEGHRYHTRDIEQCTFLSDVHCLMIVRYVLVYPPSKQAPKGLEWRDMLKPYWMPGTGNPCKEGYAAAVSAVTKSEALRYCTLTVHIMPLIIHRSSHTRDSLDDVFESQGMYHRRTYVQHDYFYIIRWYLQSCG